MPNILDILFNFMFIISDIIFKSFGFKKAQLGIIEFKYFIIGLIIGVIIGAILIYLVAKGTIPIGLKIC